jgi:hypothetical protein
MPITHTLLVLLMMPSCTMIVRREIFFSRAEQVDVTRSRFATLRDDRAACLVNLPQAVLTGAPMARDFMLPPGGLARHDPSPLPDFPVTTRHALEHASLSNIRFPGANSY